MRLLLVLLVLLLLVPPPAEAGRLRLPRRAQDAADDDVTELPNNLPCKAYVFASCSRGCPTGEANFGNGAGCVEAIKLSEACASGSCITGFNGTFLDSGDTCVASCPGGDPTSGDVC